MKKSLVFFIIISLILSLSFICFADDDTDIFTYTVSGENATITKINHDGLKEIHIPETIDGYTVTAIKNVEDVYNFGTENMVNILYIPKTVSEINASALGYFDCSKFEVDENNPFFSTDSHGVLFNKDKTILLKMPCSFMEDEYIIPDTVTEIKYYAFQTCVFLEHLTLSNKVVSISDQMCMQMINLKEINIPEGVTSIGQNSFAQCYSLEHVTLSSTLTELKNGAFTECPLLKEIIIPEGITSIGRYAFESDSSLITVTLPKSLKSIDYGVFQKCSSLSNICYPGSEEDWKTITIGSSNDTLTSAVFHYNFDTTEYKNISYIVDEELLSITGEGSIFSKGIDDWHYWDAYKDEITTIILSEDIDEIGSFSFDNFQNLKMVVSENNTLTVGASAFEGCTELRNIVKWGDISFKENSVKDCNNVRIFTNGDVTGIDNSFIVKYSCNDETLNISDKAEFEKYDFFDILGVICNHCSFNRITFSDISFKDIDLYYTTTNENGSAKTIQIEDNHLVNGDIKVKDKTGSYISFNELTEGLENETITDFTLIVTDENHPLIVETPVNVESDKPSEEETEKKHTISLVGKITSTILKGIKWAVTLINKLFKYINKK